MQINWQMGCCAVTAQARVGSQIVLLTREHGALQTRVERYDAQTMQEVAPLQMLPNAEAEALLS